MWPAQLANPIPKIPSGTPANPNSQIPPKYMHNNMLLLNYVSKGFWTMVVPPTIDNHYKATFIYHKTGQ
jgi:hypothetical protein